ncbi:MAG: bifunctional metallophosphatase/5'-nucleotidase [Deltaproteobacteria bacterium]|nr:bifunctional metallophosphatase/5'-nucleotidase [Deltaproteobacteria bacterium]
MKKVYIKTILSKQKRPFIVLTLIFLLSCSVKERESYNLSGQDIRLTILHTSDIHSRLFPYKYSPLATDEDLGLDPAKGPFGGFARIAYIIKREREKSPRSVYLDSGDIFQGAPVFNLFKGEVEFTLLSELKPAAVVIGNHEFDLGVKNLQAQYVNYGFFPLLAANYIFDLGVQQKSELGRFVSPYTIVDVEGLKLGIIGMGDIDSIYSIGEGGNSLGITPLDTYTVLTKYINEIKDRVDLVIVLSHMGLSHDVKMVQGYETWLREEETPPKGWIRLEDKEPIQYEDPNTPLKEESDNPDIEYREGWVKYKVPGVRGIDIILGGHLHIVTDPPKVLKDIDGRDVIICHSGAFAKFVGRLDVVIRDGEVKDYVHQIFPVDSTVPEDAEIVKKLEPYRITLYDEMQITRPVAFSLSKIRRFNAGGGDSQLGNLVADAMRVRKRVEAEFAITNSLGIRTDFDQGLITIEDLYNVFPFENTLTIMYLSGAEVQETLDFISRRSAERGCKTQAQVSGISFVMNCTQKKAENIGIGGSGLSCEVDSDCEKEEFCAVDKRCRKPLDPSSSYKLATNDYIAGGGSGFIMLKRNTTKYNTKVSLRDTLKDYIQTFSVCSDEDFKHLDSNTAKRLRESYDELSRIYKQIPCINLSKLSEGERIKIKNE